MYRLTSTSGCKIEFIPFRTSLLSGLIHFYGMSARSTLNSFQRFAPPWNLILEVYISDLVHKVRVSRNLKKIIIQNQLSNYRKLQIEKLISINNSRTIQIFKNR
jgi:hypothetical protein